jgi:hypothetical protein
VLAKLLLRAVQACKRELVVKINMALNGQL